MGEFTEGLKSKGGILMKRRWMFYDVRANKTFRIQNEDHLYELLAKGIISNETQIYDEENKVWQRYDQSSLMSYTTEPTKLTPHSETEVRDKIYFPNKKKVDRENKRKNKSQDKKQVHSTKDLNQILKRILKGMLIILLALGVCVGGYSVIKSLEFSSKQNVVQKSEQVDLERSFKSLYNVPIYEFPKKGKKIAQTAKGEIVKIIKIKKRGKAVWGQLKTANWVPIKDEFYIYMKEYKNED